MIGAFIQYGVGDAFSVNSQINYSRFHYGRRRSLFIAHRTLNVFAAEASHRSLVVQGADIGDP